MKNTEKLNLMTRSTVKKRNDNLHFDPARFGQAMEEDRSIYDENCNPFLDESMDDEFQADLNRRYSLMMQQDIYLDRIKKELMHVPAFYIITPFDYLSGNISIALNNDFGSRISKSMVNLSLMNEYNLFSHKDLFMNKFAAGYIQEKLNEDKYSIKLYNSYKLYEIVINDFYEIESRYAHPFDNLLNTENRNPDDDLEISFTELIDIFTIDLGFNSKIFIKQFTKDEMTFRNFTNWIKESITNIYGMNQCMDSLGEYDPEQFFNELSECIERDNKNGHFNNLISSGFLECFVMGVIPFDAGEIIVFLERLNKYYIHHHVIPAKVNSNQYIYQGLETFL
jgi:hypothetical protein